MFSFEKLTDVDTHLGPEMKSTGEVLGIGNNLEEALYKGLIASGYKMRKGGGVFITVRDQDKGEIGEIAKKFDKMGFSLYATTGTAMVLAISGPVREDRGQDPRELREHHHPAGERQGELRHLHLRQGPQPRPGQREDPPEASLLGIPCMTAIDTANALADSLMSRYTPENTEIIDINHLKKSKQKLKFTKMSACSNDYIYINCFDRRTRCPLRSFCPSSSPTGTTAWAATASSSSAPRTRPTPRCACSTWTAARA